MLNTTVPHLAYLDQCANSQDRLAAQVRFKTFSMARNKRSREIIYTYTSIPTADAHTTNWMRTTTTGYDIGNSVDLVIFVSYSFSVLTQVGGGGGGGKEEGYRKHIVIPFARRLSGQIIASIVRGS